MITKEQIERINALYKKKVESGLTEEEAKEQAELRRLYIDSFKQNLKSQLDNIDIVDVDKQDGKAHEGSKDHKHLHKHGKGCTCGHHHHKH